ncbi:MAG: hypothetical protein PHX34_02970 [Candidatus Shapirobacteria bacterium]|nr:hypothetical protein [Candidatus Shapirobacteria bacterium]
MQVYFVASSRLVGKDAKLYGRMYKCIAEGNKMVSNKVWQWLKMGVKDLRNESLRVKRENYEYLIKCLKKAEVVVTEVSGHSMSAGYLISQALDMNKPVIALYKADSKPVFIAGINNRRLFLVEYDENNIEKVLKSAFKKVSGLVDVRFNFFVSPKILNYLDWIGQKRMIPKSVFLRNLIEREMKKDHEFKG